MTTELDEALALLQLWLHVENPKDYEDAHQKTMQFTLDCLADSSPKTLQIDSPGTNTRCPRCGFVTANVFDCPTCKGRVDLSAPVPQTVETRNAQGDVDGGYLDWKATAEEQEQIISSLQAARWANHYRAEAAEKRVGELEEKLAVLLAYSLKHETAPATPDPTTEVPGR